MEEEKLNNTETDKDNYLGNIWGWKVSLWGLFFIIFLIILMYINWDSSVKMEELPLRIGE